MEKGGPINDPLHQAPSAGYAAPALRSPWSEQLCAWSSSKALKRISSTTENTLPEAFLFGLMFKDRFPQNQRFLWGWFFQGGAD